MSLEINYIDSPEGAQEKMVASGENGNSISTASSISTGSKDTPWATLEPGVWKLDGTIKILSENQSPGWWSVERSGSDCRFANSPKVTISFPTPYGSTGFTIRFSPSTKQWCSEVHVTWYNGQSVLVDKVYYPGSALWELAETVDSFDRVDFEFIATNHPGHFAKIQKIEIGRTVLFGADEIVSCRIINEIDPTLCRIPIDTISFEMHDSKNRSFLPQENQRIELLKNGSLVGTQYIKSSTRNSKSDYSIRCQSSIGLLNDDFLGGLYSDKPVENLLSEILGEWEFDLDRAFQGIKINGYIPVCSQREALQQVAFSIGAIVTTQDSAKIRLVPIPKAISARFSKSDIILGGNVKTASRYAKVEIYSHTYAKQDVVETLIREEEIDGENVLITFASPHYDYEITGGTILSYGDNWVRITPSGPVTINAKNYRHSTRSHTKRNPEATAREQGNVISVKEATLITSGNVYEALDRLYSAVQRRQTVSQPVIVGSQKAGQMASSMTPWGTVARGFISTMDSQLTQTGHIAKIQGIEVAMDSVWFYSGEIYSGGEEVVY